MISASWHAGASGRPGVPTCRRDMPTSGVPQMTAPDTNGDTAHAAPATSPTGDQGSALGGGQKTTPLLGVHKHLGATLTPFPGWLMPLRYATQTPQHNAVRTAAGLFDLSHMGEI